MFELFMYVYSCNALSARFFAVDRALNSYFVSMIMITVRHGMAERVYRLEFVSNQGFTDSEFSKWRETMMLTGLNLPSVYDLEKKIADIKFAMNYSFKESDIEEVCRPFFCPVSGFYLQGDYRTCLEKLHK